MQRQSRRQRAATWAVAAVAVLLLGAAAPTRTPGPPAEPTASTRPRLGQVRSYTLLDPSLALPPLEAMAPDLSLVARQRGDESQPPVALEPPPAVQWKLGYRHAQLDDLPSAALRNDPSTGFSRQLDTDVLALGMSWNVEGNQVGFAYQLQSARGGGDTGLSRFLPGSEAATHALTLGVRHEFGAGAPPPAPPPLLVLDDAPPPTGDAATPPPSPAP